MIIFHSSIVIRGRQLRQRTLQNTIVNLSSTRTCSWLPSPVCLSWTKPKSSALSDNGEPPLSVGVRSSLDTESSVEHEITSDILPGLFFPYQTILNETALVFWDLRTRWQHRKTKGFFLIMSKWIFPGQGEESWRNKYWFFLGGAVFGNPTFLPNSFVFVCRAFWLALVWVLIVAPNLNSPKKKATIDVCRATQLAHEWKTITCWGLEDGRRESLLNCKTNILFTWPFFAFFLPNFRKRTNKYN